MAECDYFLDKRQHHGVVWRAQIEPNYVNDLLGKVRIVADLECLLSVRIEVRCSPDLPDLPSGDLRVPGLQPDAPMSSLLGNPVDRQCEDFFDFLSPNFKS